MASFFQYHKRCPWACELCGDTGTNFVPFSTWSLSTSTNVSLSGRHYSMFSSGHADLANYWPVFEAVSLCHVRFVDVERKKHMEM